MTEAAIHDVAKIPRIAHDEAMRIAKVENCKFAALLRSFEPGDCTKPTDCTLWDAQALIAHVVGLPPARLRRASSSVRSARDAHSSPRSAASSGGTG